MLRKKYSLQLRDWVLRHPILTALCISLIDTNLMAIWLVFVFIKKFNTQNNQKLDLGNVVNILAYVAFAIFLIYSISLSYPPRNFYFENKCEYYQPRPDTITQNDENITIDDNINGFEVSFLSHPWPYSIKDSIWFYRQEIVEHVPVLWGALKREFQNKDIEEIGVSGGWQPRFLYIKVKGELFRRYQGHISYNCIQKLKEYAKKTGYADKFKLP